MSGEQNEATTISLDKAFLKSTRGILKVAEMGTLFVAFVCFSVASVPKYIAATVLELLITSLLLLLYILKLNKKLTFFFWPFVDVFNSVFAAVYFVVLSSMALASYTVTGTLVGGIIGFVVAGLLCVDCYTLFRKITFNNSRSTSRNQGNS